MSGLAGVARQSPHGVFRQQGVDEAIAYHPEQVPMSFRLVALVLRSGSVGGLPLDSHDGVSESALPLDDVPVLREAAEVVEEEPTFFRVPSGLVEGFGVHWHKSRRFTWEGA